MKLYPSLYETKKNLTADLFLKKNQASYTKYLSLLTRKWCKCHNLSYEALIASLCSLVLQGIIKVERKDRGFCSQCVSDPLSIRGLTAQSPEEYLYRLYNKHGVLLSDYTDNDLILSYKQELLEKFGGVNVPKKRRERLYF